MTATSPLAHAGRFGLLSCSHLSLIWVTVSFISRMNDHAKEIRFQAKFGIEDQDLLCERSLRQIESVLNVLTVSTTFSVSFTHPLTRSFPPGICGVCQLQRLQRSPAAANRPNLRREVCGGHLLPAERLQERLPLPDGAVRISLLLHPPHLKNSAVFWPTTRILILSTPGSRCRL